MQPTTRSVNGHSNGHAAPTLPLTDLMSRLTDAGLAPEAPTPMPTLPADPDAQLVAVVLGLTRLAGSLAEAVAGLLGMRAEAARQATAEAAAPARVPRRHSLDFRSVIWDGASYSLTGIQAAVVRALWEAYEDGTPELSQVTLIEAGGGDENGRVRDHFRNHPAWGTLIVRGRAKGTYCLKT